MKIFDTHAHYDDKAFEDDRDKLLSLMPENNIELIMNVGADIAGSKATIALADKYSFIYGAIGVHPENTAEMKEEDIDWLKEQSVHSKVRAIGEIGLDYYWKETPQEVQKKWFDLQLELAKEVKLPVIIHSRDAAKDTLDVLHAAEAGTKLSGVIHCYSYSEQTAREYLDMGFYFGIGGVITFQNAKKIREAVAYIPLENIVLETDCPYLAPVPFRGKRNTSLNLNYVLQEIASIKGMSCEAAAEATYVNGKNLYGIEGE